MTNPGADPLVGRSVAHYEILARLGGGGMGVVYKARDVRLGRIVALKFLPPQWSHDENAKQRFVREAQAASATEHRHICTIHDIASTDDGQLFIVMAYYEGQTLKQRLESGPLTVDEALDIATQVAEGLARAHAQSVVHRDIKPGNLLLAEDGVRILDFGLATFADALQITIVGSTLGTAAYMSPEQARGEVTDARTDVWAVGIILYQMLTGHVPFRGAYAEAILHAIRNDTPAPIRTTRSDVPEDVEQVVFRALHKDITVRYASGRELARALRQVRGQTVPLDLRTEPVMAPAKAGLPKRRRRTGVARYAAIAAALLVAIGATGWILWPEPVDVVVVPLSDQSGEPELEGYQRALTYALVHELSYSRAVRPVSWPRTLETLRGFIAAGTGLASRNVVQALTGAGGSRVLVLPTLLYEDEKWRVRVEIRDGTSLLAVGTYLSDPEASALPKETAYRLAVEAADLVERHFDSVWLRLAPSRDTASRLRTLDAAKLFEEGLSTYEDQDYPTAHELFRKVAAMEPQSPLAHAWSSRAARMMRNDVAAAEAASAALRLVGDETPPTDRLFIEAVAAEAQVDRVSARERYDALVARDARNALWAAERAAFSERNAGADKEWADAVTAYLGVLSIDSSLIRPHLELCRLYVSLQEFQKAKTEGLAALAAYERTGSRNGQAFARFCLVDALRSGSEADRTEALTHADAALRVMQQSGSAYQLARAQYYRGMVAAEQRRLAEALEYWGPAVELAERSGNVILMARLFNVLGVAHQRRGNGAESAEYYQRSADAYGRLGDQRGAARQQVNSASLRIAYGVNGEEAVNDVRNALEVMRERGDPDFEVTCHEAIASHYRHVGRYADADRELTQALNRADQFDLMLKMDQLRLQQARLQIDKSDYAAARTLLLDLIEHGSANSVMQGWLQLGRVQTRLGDFEAARGSLLRVEEELRRRGDDGVRLAFFVAAGELAFEAGQFEEARQRFQQAASEEIGAFVDQAVVDARAYLALIDTLQRTTAPAHAVLVDSLERAKKMGRLAVAARYRVFMARSYLDADKKPEARRVLEEMPPSVVDALGLELKAQVHYWASRALEERDAAAAHLASARRAVDSIGSALPERDRASFAARREVRMITN